jgi:hypothetical protein
MQTFWMRSVAWKCSRGEIRDIAPETSRAGARPTAPSSARDHRLPYDHCEDNEENGGAYTRRDEDAQQ